MIVAIWSKCGLDSFEHKSSYDLPSPAVIDPKDVPGLALANIAYCYQHQVWHVIQ